MTGNNVGNHATLKYMRIGWTKKEMLSCAIQIDNHKIIELATDNASKSNFLIIAIYQYY